MKAAPQRQASSPACETEDRRAGVPAAAGTLHDSPRLVAQRQRRDAAFGPPGPVELQGVALSTAGAEALHRSPRASAQRKLVRASFGPAIHAASVMPAAPVARAGPVLQAAWATVQGTMTRLNLAELKGQVSPGGKQLYADNKTGLQYEWVSGTTNDDRVVKAYVASPSSSNPLQSDYEDWDSTKTTSKAMDTPFGKASARHSRGAPFAQTNKTDYGGNGVGDAYTDMFHALRDGSHDTSDDAELATALLQLDKTKLDTDLQKNAAAKLTVAVYLAEEWRKQGATKIWRALLRLVERKQINLDRAGQLFAFVESADAGRQQVARFQDVYEEDMSESDLTKDERMIYGAMSPIGQDDFSSDDELRNKKELKTKSRLFATKHQENDDSD